MDRKAGIDDYEFIRKRWEELKSERSPKPRCPRHDGGSCLSPCSQMSDCFEEAKRNNAQL